LKGKLAETTGVSLNVTFDDAKQDISNALLALGYNEKEAASAMKSLPADIGTSDGIRQALKLLSKV
jgi:Holliday junction DNA helicase RuvA